MKKRSLFAAVAMLIVSAILLTSATYAWFSAGGTTQISTITGNVAQASPGIRLSTKASSGYGRSGWVNTLDYVKLARDESNNHFATNWTTTGNKTGTLGTDWDYAPSATGTILKDGDNDLTYMPVSTGGPLPLDSSNALITTNPPQTVFAYNLDAAGNYTATSGTVSTFYDDYRFKVGMLSEDATADVLMKVKVEGTAKAAARCAIYTSTDNGAHYTLAGIYSGTSESGWKPMIAALDTTNYYYKDTNNNNFIIDTNDDTDDTALASKISGSAVSTTEAAAYQTIHLGNVHVMDPETSGVYNTEVRCIVWLEGNDGDCKPTHATVPGGNIQVTYTFELA